MKRDKTTDPKVFIMALAIGIVAGLRSLAAPAFVSQMARSGAIGVEAKRFGLFGNPVFAKVLVGLASSEAVADKLGKVIPDRTSAIPLMSRMISGAICGAVLCSVKDESPVVGAVAGSFGALGAAYVAFELRQQAQHSLGLPDTALGLIEDATAVWIGTAIASTLKQVETA